MSQLFVVIDIGCLECGVDSEPVGCFNTQAEADQAAVARQALTAGWRDGGQTLCQVFAMVAPAADSTGEAR